MRPRKKSRVYCKPTNPIDLGRVIKEAHYVKTWSGQTFLNARNGKFINARNCQIINGTPLFRQIKSAYHTSGRIFAKRSRMGAPLLRVILTRQTRF